VPPSGEETRQKLLDAATELFAERGIQGTALSDITRAAGQRNASALQYHFRSREELIAALCLRHVPQIRQRRIELLEIARASADNRRAAEAMVLPTADLLHGDWRERCFVRIAVELLSDTRRYDVPHLLGYTASIDGMKLLATRLSVRPLELLRLRISIASTMIVHAIADHAKVFPDGQSPTETALFVENILDIYMGIVDAPVNDVTAKALRAARRGRRKAAVEAGSKPLAKTKAKGKPRSSDGANGSARLAGQPTSKTASPTVIG
jgi:AcrR family transcriptional regulator